MSDHTPMPAPVQPPQYQVPQYPPPQYAPQQAPKASGLAISSFVVGLVAFLICLIPVVNVVAIIGAVVALVLGVVAVNKARKGLAGGKGLAIAGIVLSTLAILGAIIANIVFGVAVSAVDEAVQESVQDAQDQAEDRGVQATEEEQQAAAEAQALPLGQSAEVGEYTVTVKAVNTNANDIVASANEFNEPPTNQYVLVDVAVVYNGAEEGDPWIDLTHNFVGTDARQYDSSACSAVTPSSVMDVPTLNAGGAAEYQVCMDVPASAIEGGTLSVEETLSFQDTTVVWAAR